MREERGHYIQHAHTHPHTHLSCCLSKAIVLTLICIAAVSWSNISSTCGHQFHSNSRRTLKSILWQNNVKAVGGQSSRKHWWISNVVGPHIYGKEKANMHTHARTSSLYHSLSLTHTHTDSHRLQAWLKPLSLSLAARILYATQPSLLWRVGKASHIQNKLVGMLNFAKTKTDARRQTHSRF